MDVPEFGTKRDNEERRDGGCAVVFDPRSKRFAMARHENGLLGFFSGGVEKGEDIKIGVLREVEEESGLYDFKLVEKVAEAMCHYFNELKKVSRVAHATCFLIVINSTQVKPVHLEAHEKFRLEWVGGEEIVKNWNERNQNRDYDHWIYFFNKAREKLFGLAYDL